MAMIPLLASQVESSLLDALLLIGSMLLIAYALHSKSK
jgi:hypothetical protein